MANDVRLALLARGRDAVDERLDARREHGGISPRAVVQDFPCAVNAHTDGGSEQRVTAALCVPAASTQIDLQFNGVLNSSCGRAKPSMSSTSPTSFGPFCSICLSGTYTKGRRA